mgnify:CR=1 FL=1
MGKDRVLSRLILTCLAWAYSARDALIMSSAMFQSSSLGYESESQRTVFSLSINTMRELTEGEFSRMALCVFMKALLSRRFTMRRFTAVDCGQAKSINQCGFWARLLTWVAQRRASLRSASDWEVMMKAGQVVMLICWSSRFW